MANKIDYENVLNPAQLEAVMTHKGPILVIAGAGSGKTRTLVYRVARLVETGVPPESILLLTFTRKAAREMLDRAAGLSDARCRFVSGGTFHSLALRVLRSHAELIGFMNTFTILDRSDMEEIIHSLVPELGMPKGTPRFPKRGTIANILSKAANVRKSVDDIMTDEYGQFLQFVPQINRLGMLYRDYKKTNQLMDYDDLILNLLKLLKENVDIRRDLSRKYSYEMVDEYQDTNTIQSEIVGWLAHEHRNVMVVGDDSQSIYSFRGADYRNMFDFPLLFPEAKIIKLEENYRSIQPILTFTNALMGQAAEKYTKCLFTRRTGGERPKIIDTRTEPEQAMFICRHIKELMQQGRPISDMAVLFRAGYHSFEVEAELTRQGVNYVKYGGFKFLESAHIKDFLAHLRVIVNGDEAVSWVRILRLVKNIGQAKTQTIIKWMKANRISPERLLEWPGAASNVKGLKPLSELLGRLAAHKGKPSEAVELVMDYYLPILREKFDDYPRRQKELEQLIPMAGRYKKLKGFLDDLVLEPPAGPADIDSGEKAESLTLSTVHSAKGLEWPVVLIIWVMDGRFPPARACDDPLAMEEELRLMYVAATRAKDELIMCYPGQESAPSWALYGRPGSGFRNGVSSLIADLGQDIVSYESAGFPARIPIGESKRKDSSLNGEGTPNGPERREYREHGEPLGFSQGDRVNHPAFGAGVVSKFVSNDKVEVLFRNVGRKLLHLEYTTLEKI
ncbi:MAG: UvrD-helicase domain-containing protein [Thermodesulfobacteriota bacterium]|nr:UvrD-helicase domain-containing protein [Thermodesulfobacteriota bacterium]